MGVHGGEAVAYRVVVVRCEALRVGLWWEHGWLWVWVGVERWEGVGSGWVGGS